ncbi:class II aldolase/adducin family protein [Microbacterium sp. B2969]|uniref:L-ribulose-5-phosphate 4-epimerase n=1 Tax=Microbacterium alkaliflavum TaxID=3248839 RepID=A0ABW7QCT7_9MICO
MAQGREAELREKYVSGVKTEVAIARARADVAAVHAELLREGLALPMGGSVSGKVPKADLFVITPAGMPFAEVAPENLVLCGLDGEAVPGTPGSELAPSVAAAGHGYVYRHMPAVGGVVHTLSPYASAWAARGEEIPCALAVVAEEFGGPVPVGESALGDHDALGHAVVDVLAGRRARAVLLRGQGPVAVGATAREAASVAGQLEGVARIVQLAQDGGLLTSLPQSAVDRLYEERHAHEPPQADRPAASKQPLRQLNTATKTKTSR